MYDNTVAKALCKLLGGHKFELLNSLLYVRRIFILTLVKNSTH